MKILYQEEVEFGLRDGRDSYDEQKPGIGDYFVDSMLADTESLTLYAGIHSEHFGFFRLHGKTFIFAIYCLNGEEQVTVYAAAPQPGPEPNRRHETSNSSQTAPQARPLDRQIVRSPKL